MSAANKSFNSKVTAMKNFSCYYIILKHIIPNFFQKIADGNERKVINNL
jgi:hypothetical protein